MSPLRVRPASARDHDLLAGLLRELSAESAYRRFQVGLGPEPAPALVAALLPDGHRGGAVLGFVGERLVAHGLWVRVGAAPAAEIALVVADPHQGKGIGTQIAAALTADLAARGVARVEVFASATNDAVTRMVARQAPDAVRERDGATVTYSFAVPVGALAERRTSEMVDPCPRSRSARTTSPTAPSWWTSSSRRPARARPAPRCGAITHPSPRSI